MNNFRELEEKIKYKFADENILFEALTHSSYSNENKEVELICNERLEFLGDSVLGMIIGDYLFTTHPDFPEGELTKLRAKIVCEPTLSECSKDINLGKYMFFGKGEEITGGRNRVSILADAYEALVAAIYIDGGLEKARAFILRTLNESIQDALNGKIFLDYKTTLQENIQSKSNEPIIYNIVKEKGPDHRKEFFAEVLIGECRYGTGNGNSKKEAEQNAAKEALRRITKSE